MTLGIHHHYFACNSKASLRDVTVFVQNFSPVLCFSFDGEEFWEFAEAQEPGRLHLAITKADDDTTISTWMPSCPEGVNFQIIITAEAVPSELIKCLEQSLSATLVAYHLSSVTEDYLTQRQNFHTECTKDVS